MWRGSRGSAAPDGRSGRGTGPLRRGAWRMTCWRNFTSMLRRGCEAGCLAQVWLWRNRQQENRRDQQRLLSATTLTTQTTHVFDLIRSSSQHPPNLPPATMKLQATLAVAAACVATTAAFTVGRRPGSALQRQLTTASTAGRTYSSSSSALRMSAEADYVKGEISSADVSGCWSLCSWALVYTWAWVVRSYHR